MVLFTDAVTAIAITLLVLPLVDIVPEAAAAHASPASVITEHRGAIVGFLLSFAVIARTWMGHHDLFSTVETYRRSLSVINMGWLLTIVVLPFPTEMVGVYGSDRFVAAFYVGTILVASVLQLAMARILRDNPELTSDQGKRATRSVASGTDNVIALVLALVIGLLLPSTAYYDLLLVAVVTPVRRVFGRRSAEDR
jgi:uncharacterized membrane protein